MGNQSSSLHQAAAHNDLHEVQRIFAEHDGNVNDRDKVSKRFQASVFKTSFKANLRPDATAI